MTISAFRGLGRADNADNVGNTNNAYGLASSKTLIITTSSKPCRKAKHKVTNADLVRILNWRQKKCRHEENRK